MFGQPNETDDLELRFAFLSKFFRQSQPVTKLRTIDNERLEIQQALLRANIDYIVDLPGAMAAEEYCWLSEGVKFYFNQLFAN